LAEEYDAKRGGMIGNFPQAFSHLALIHSASVLSNAELTPRAKQRATNGGQERAAAPRG
jgi:glucoamylase